MQVPMAVCGYIPTYVYIHILEVFTINNINYKINA